MDDLLGKTLPLFKHSLDSERYLRTFFHAFLLSFLAGSVNVGGFMACGRFVTHVTGFATLFGVDMANGNWMAAFGILSVPFYFLLGSMISATLVDRQLRLGRQAKYPVVMGLVSLCLATAAIAGHLRFFGLFGINTGLQQTYILLALLCGASGLQNASMTMYSGTMYSGTTYSGTTLSGSFVRTTHMTGIVTDLGIGIVRAFTPIEDKTHQLRELRLTWLRSTTLFAFMVGSLMGAFLFHRFEYLGFLLPASIAVYAMLVSLRK